MDFFDVVTLSRLQFAITALYHFIFVPLTLGLSMLLAVMETVYVATGRPIWRQITKFWGVLFGINFVLGVSTGIVMEFQFGMNWSYYSHYVGDIFGAPLAIEALMAFFMEATFIGLFFFGWDRLSKGGHLLCTWLVALGSNLSALWILIANGWMQNPEGSVFNPLTMRMEVDNFGAVLMNIVAQTKFLHTVSAGYVTASVFVIGVSSWYLLKGRVPEVAKRSIVLASSFGLIAAASVILVGDEAGYLTGQHQKMKLAAMEAHWTTEDAPADFVVAAFPDQEAGENHYAIKIPWVGGILVTRSLDGRITGINDLVNEAKDRIRSGITAYWALNAIRDARKAQRAPEQEDLDRFNEHSRDLGYGLLLKKYVPGGDIRGADDAAIEQAARDTVPPVAYVFWTFRIMVGLGFYLILFLLTFYIISAKNALEKRAWLLRLAVFSIPLPWIAAECGWMVAELGRQPWIIEGVLPTAVAVSNHTAESVQLTLAGFTAIYFVLLIVEVSLMVRAVRRGPELELAHDAGERPVFMGG
ncbi:MAG: cytochrome ubiquinol oxidase subunit I [Methylobacteriaceae bacterium]|jgi:cytochrome d ubiquinol oxidase subunit I|nr:cytochrome ubiquinol oxidase subunit I [Methylobacteriaceae bacterium]